MPSRAPRLTTRQEILDHIRMDLETVAITAGLKGRIAGSIADHLYKNIAQKSPTGSIPSNYAGLQLKEKIEALYQRFSEEGLSRDDFANVYATFPHLVSVPSETLEKNIRFIAPFLMQGYFLPEGKKRPRDKAEAVRKLVRNGTYIRLFNRDPATIHARALLQDLYPSIKGYEAVVSTEKTRDARIKKALKRFSAATWPKHAAEAGFPPPKPPMRPDSRAAWIKAIRSREKKPGPENG